MVAVVAMVVGTVVEVVDDDEVVDTVVVVEAVEVVASVVVVDVSLVVLVVVVRLDSVPPVVVGDSVVAVVDVDVDSAVEVVPAPVFDTEVVEPGSFDVDVVVGIAYKESTGPSPGSSGVDPVSQATPSLSASRLSR